MSQNLGPRYGLGTLGSKAVTSNEDINSVKTSCSISAGSVTLVVADETGFSVGDLVLMHKGRGMTTTDTGTHELNRVVAVTTGQLTLGKPVDNAYQDSGDEQSQVVLVPEYTGLIIDNTFTAAPTAWDQNTGGIWIAAVRGQTKVVGTISVVGKGFLGGAGVTSAIGFQGEGEDGAKAQLTAANGNGGGGGTSASGAASAGGGGGGHANNGSNGIAGSGETPGTGGSPSGSADLVTATFGGGGGGGGRGDGVSGNAGNGAIGGGFFWLITRDLLVTGSMTCDGIDGTDGTEEGSGGAGSAAGSGKCTFDTANIGTDLISASKGLKGVEGPGGNGGDGGDGSDGRLRFEGGKLTGSTSLGSVSTDIGGHDWLGDCGFV